MYSTAGHFQESAVLSVFLFHLQRSSSSTLNSDEPTTADNQGLKASALHHTGSDSLF